MNAIERHIEDSRTACLDFVNASFDVLLQKVKANGDFLDEMNAKSTNDFEPQAEYVATMIVEAPKPEIPTDAELTEALAQDAKAAEKAELVKRLDLEQTGETKMMPEDRWVKLCSYVIIGHENKLEVSKKWVSDTLMKQGLSITSTQEEHLEELRNTRRQMLSKDMDLAGAQALNWATDGEKQAFAELAKKENLK